MATAGCDDDWNQDDLARAEAIIERVEAMPPRDFERLARVKVRKVWVIANVWAT